MRFAAGHDYYDSVLQYGRDTSIFFERSSLAKARYLEHGETSLVDRPPAYLGFKGESSWRRYNAITINRREYNYDTQLVWFAGERYSGIKLTIRDQMSYGTQEPPQWFWTKEAFLNHLEALMLELDDEHWLHENRLSSDNLDSFFSYSPRKAETDWLIDNRISVAISATTDHQTGWLSKGRPGWYVNCDGLDKLGFAKCLDPYSAFQKLSQWVGGVLTGEGKPMVKITDEKVVLKKHGFDKQSFRHRAKA